MTTAMSTAMNDRPKTVTELLGVPDPPKTGRERILAVAIELFYRNGFGAIGIDRVIAAAGVTKTTFYKHFESKDDLMVAAVKRRDEWESQAWGTAIRKIAGDDPARWFTATLEVMDHFFNAPDFGGCMFLNTAIEFPNPNDPIHQAAAAYKLRARNGWRDLAKAAGADATNAEIFADCFAALIEGALILRQTHGRNDAARAIRPAVEQLLQTYLPATKQTASSTGDPPVASVPRRVAQRQSPKR
jgi:AcrR family transcriptional regulator